MSTHIHTICTHYIHTLHTPPLYTHQIQRLVWVLSTPGMHRGALLLVSDEDADAHIVSTLGVEEQQVLRDFGWQQGCGIRTMLNFQGVG